MNRIIITMVSNFALAIFFLLLSPLVLGLIAEDVYFAWFIGNNIEPFFANHKNHEEAKRARKFSDLLLFVATFLLLFLLTGIFSVLSKSGRNSVASLTGLFCVIGVSFVTFCLSIFPIVEAYRWQSLFRSLKLASPYHHCLAFLVAEVAMFLLLPLVLLFLSFLGIFVNRKANDTEEGAGNDGTAGHPEPANEEGGGHDQEPEAVGQTEHGDDAAEGDSESSGSSSDEESDGH